ncbi:MAG: hypothetical protein AAGL17_09610 [Cyanobacteria bacterium J06576_12]
MGNAERKNVFVVGAGASREFGLPTGAELLDGIAQKAIIGFNENNEIVGDKRLFDQFRALAKSDDRPDPTASQYINACSFIKDNMALAPSIDNFLHTHSGNRFVVRAGKALISKVILESEAQSSVKRKYDENFDFDKKTERYDPLRETWLAQLFRLMVSEKDFAGFVKGLTNIIFISFNYDRCIEEFLVGASNQYFSCTPDQKAEIEAAIRVVHPYGWLGPIGTGPNSVAFGEESDSTDIIAISEGIRTFTEGLSNSALFGEIETAFREAEVCVFLGFGFLRLNLDLLFEGKEYNLDRVIGTAKGSSSESTMLIERYLRDKLLFGGHSSKPMLIRSSEDKLKLSNVTCADLFWEHSRFLQGG